MSVAVKIIARGEITQQMRSSIKSEVAEMMLLMHPNCVRVLGFTEQPTMHVSLVTEWLLGGNMAQFLRSTPSASEEHRLDLFVHVCSAGARRRASAVLFRLALRPLTLFLSRPHPQLHLPSSRTQAGS
jgi:serine/threonine protein kinase